MHTMPMGVQQVVFYEKSNPKNRKRGTVEKLTGDTVILKSGKKFDRKTGEGLSSKKYRLDPVSLASVSMGSKIPSIPGADKLKKMAVSPTRSKPMPYIIQCVDARNFTIAKWVPSLNKGEGGYQPEGYYTNLDHLIQTLLKRLIASRAKKAELVTANEIEAAARNFQKCIDAQISAAFVSISPKFLESYRKLEKIQDLIERKQMSIDEVLTVVLAQKKTAKKRAK